MPKHSLALLALLALGVAPELSAQTDYYGRIGVTGASTLVRDVIVQPITVQQSLAPTFVAGASIPIAPQYRVGLEGALSVGSVESEQANDQRDLGTLTTASALLNLEGPIRAGFSWRAGLGVLVYLPGDDDGIFAQGGATRMLIGGGVDYRRPLLHSWDLMASARYGYHRFTTDELDSRGFTGAQGVHRVSVSIGLARSRR